ncbi:MAG: Sua5/YciO/YrdC/YwlC family protein [Bacteroidales bacterium]|nr:Sua5/YciO/YrdC/YwlC family protein [Bacteroidales bacterium]
MKDSVILKQGKVLIYPTDTIWGIGCSALNVAAIERVKAIKGRDNTKSLIVLVKDIEMLGNYVQYIPQCAIDLINSAKEPTTVIYPKAKNLPVENLSFNESIGIRIPKNDYLQKLFEEIDFPIVSTSANFSGKPSPRGFGDIDEEFLKKADYVSKYGRQEEDCDKNVSDSENVQYKKASGSSIYLIENDTQLKKIR